VLSYGIRSGKGKAYSAPVFSLKKGGYGHPSLRRRGSTEWIHFRKACFPGKRKSLLSRKKKKPAFLQAISLFHG
jgi:hypothetical protein